jgi:putative ABC transport system substrate-binding protein
MVARAQEARKVAVVGVLWHAGNEQEEAIFLGAFRKGLTDLGYIEGKNIKLENRFAAENYERFNSMAHELVNLKVDVLFAVTPPASLAAQRATSMIPIVFIIDPDPVARKLVDSLARPGANITGLTAALGDLTGKRLEALREVIPDLTRVALLVNPTSPLTAGNIDTSRTTASALGIAVQPIEVRTPSDFEPAFSLIVKGGFGGVHVQCDSLNYNERHRIADLSLRERLPCAFCQREYVDAGGLISYGVGFRAEFYRAAIYIDKILKGEKPGDIPVERPTKFELVVNLKTARALGLTIPAPLLARADEVIE